MAVGFNQLVAQRRLPHECVEADPDDGEINARAKHSSRIIPLRLHGEPYCNGGNAHSGGLQQVGIKY
jgi:hypothetical protein